MHKFELSVYKGIWEDKNVITQILQNPDLIRANHTFWREDFSVDPNITETNAEGEAVFTSRMRAIDTGVLMDMRAPLGDSTPEDVKGMEAYQGTIQEFISKGYVETAEMRDYKRRLFEEIGDATLVRRFAEDVLQPRIDSANQTLSHMAAQLISTGKIIYNQGQGIQGNVLKADVPAKNFLKAGAKVWSDPTANLLDQMVKIEEDIREAEGLELKFQWEVTRQMFLEYFMKNNQVVEWVKHMYELDKGIELSSALGVTYDMVTEAIAKFPNLSPIVIVEEKQNDTENGVVHGWKDNIAVLRPVGYAGLIRRTTIKDVELFNKYGNGVNSYSFANALNGLATVANSVIVNGNFKEWHTHLILAAVPSLDEFLYHYIVDTTQAN